MTRASYPVANTSRYLTVLTLCAMLEGAVSCCNATVACSTHVMKTTLDFVASHCQKMSKKKKVSGEDVCVGGV